MFRESSAGVMIRRLIVVLIDSLTFFISSSVLEQSTGTVISLKVEIRCKRSAS